MAAASPSQHLSLRDSSLAPATMRVYNNNLNKLLLYTRHSLPQLLSLRSSVIDRKLEGWINHLYQQHGSFDYANQCLNGLIFHAPHLRIRLHRSRGALRGWSRLREARSHPPITWELTVLFALTMAKQGHIDQAVAVLVSFDCLLRVGEMTRIVLSDVIRKNDPRVGSAHPTMAIRLPRTKTGLNQWVKMDNPVVASVLHCYLEHRTFAADERIFPFSPGQFNRSLHSVASLLRVDHIPYVAHSFRHGGATSALLSGSTIEQIVLRGRWRRLESARRYIQTGPALMASWTVPRELNLKAQAIIPELLQVMTHLFDTVPQQARKVHRVRFKNLA